MRHLLTAGALVSVLALAAACADDDADSTEDDGAARDTPTVTAGESTAPSEPTSTPTSGPGSEPTADETSPAPDATVVRMTLRDGRVTPNGERIEARAGRPIVFEIDADAPGELHAHSTPEHSIEFEAGTSAHEIVIDQPGIVEVELHDPALVVVQLEVR